MNLQELSPYEMRDFMKDTRQEISIQCGWKFKQVVKTGRWNVIDISRNGDYIDGITKNQAISKHAVFDAYHIPFGRNHGLYREKYDTYSKLKLRKMSPEDFKKSSEEREYIKRLKGEDFLKEFEELTSTWEGCEEAVFAILVGVNWEISGALDGLLQLGPRPDTFFYFWSPKRRDLPVSYD